MTKRQARKAAIMLAYLDLESKANNLCIVSETPEDNKIAQAIKEEAHKMLRGANLTVGMIPPTYGGIIKYCKEKY